MADRIRSLLKSALASLVLALAMTAGAGVASAAETIKVGFLSSLSGIFAQAGKDMLDGLKIAFEQVGHQPGGPGAPLAPPPHLHLPARPPAPGPPGCALGALEPDPAPLREPAAHT